MMCKPFMFGAGRTSGCDKGTGAVVTERLEGCASGKVTILTVSGWVDGPFVCQTMSSCMDSPGK